MCQCHLSHRVFPFEFLFFLSSCSPFRNFRNLTSGPKFNDENERQILLVVSSSASERLTPVLYEKLARILDSRVTQLASDLTELRGGGVGGRHISHGKPLSSSAAPDGFKYIYHNKMNLAIKSTVLVEREYPPTGGGGMMGEDSDAASRGGGSWWFNKAASGTSSGSFSSANLAASLMNADGSTSSSGVVGGGAFGIGGSTVVAPVDCAAVMPWKVMQAIVDMQADMER